MSPKSLAAADAAALAARLGKEADRDLAAEYGMSPTTVRNWRERAGIPAFRKVKYERGEIVALFEELKSVRRVARRLGLTEQRVYQILDSYGLRDEVKIEYLDYNWRKTRAWTPEEDALLGKECDCVLAARLGVKLNVVFRRRRELGVAAFVWNKSRYSREQVVAFLEASRADFAEMAKMMGTSLQMATIYCRLNGLGRADYVRVRRTGRVVPTDEA